MIQKPYIILKTQTPHNVTSVTLVAGNLRKLLSKKYMLNLREGINKSRRDKWAKSRKGFEAQAQKTQLISKGTGGLSKVL
jgi:hypothetical protein